MALTKLEAEEILRLQKELEAFDKKYEQLFKVTRKLKTSKNNMLESLIVHQKWKLQDKHKCEFCIKVDDECTEMEQKLNSLLQLENSMESTINELQEKVKAKKDVFDDWTHKNTVLNSVLAYNCAKPITNPFGRGGYMHRQSKEELEEEKRKKREREEEKRKEKEEAERIFLASLPTAENFEDRQQPSTSTHPSTSFPTTTKKRNRKVRKTSSIRRRKEKKDKEERRIIDPSQIPYEERPCKYIILEPTPKPTSDKEEKDGTK